MSASTSIKEATRELENLGLHIGELEIIDWDEVFAFTPDSVEIKIEIVEVINKISNSVKKLKSTLA